MMINPSTKKIYYFFLYLVCVKLFYWFNWPCFTRLDFYSITYELSPISIGLNRFYIIIILYMRTPDKWTEWISNAIYQFGGTKHTHTRNLYVKQEWNLPPKTQISFDVCAGQLQLVCLCLDYIERTFI